MNNYDPSKQPGVKIAQILLERATFRHRDDYLIVATPPHPDAIVGTINVQVESGLSEDQKTGLVRMRVQTIPENRPFYELDVAMIALALVDEAAPNMPLDRYFTTSGAALLYPFVRQVVADLTWRGRFGPVWLNPMNVAAMPLTVSSEPLPEIQGPRKRTLPKIRQPGKEMHRRRRGSGKKRSK
jgi:preprotein translocase subunit SecB